MIFTYWDGDPANIGDFTADWNAAGLPVRIYDKRDVLETLRLYRPEAAAMAEDIAIPACLSDLGRLLLLHRHGGLYVDAHTGGPDAPGIARVFAKLAVSELVAFIVRPPKDPTVSGLLVSGAFCARAQSSIVEALIDTVLENLVAQQAAEHTGASAPYNIATVSGTWVARLLWFSPYSKELVLNPDLVGRIAFVRLREDNSPFVFYRHYGYRRPGRHWSERQKHERLFRTRTEAQSPGPD